MLRCSECGVFFFEKLASDELLKRYYSRYSYSKIVFLPLGVKYSIVQTLSYLKKHVKHPAPKMLDYGCGQGDTVLIAREIGFDAYGFELSEAAIELCRKRGVPMLTESEIVAKRFNVITAFEVIEHLPLPAEFLRLSSERLYDDGLLYLTTPNLHSISNKLGKYSSLVFPEHLSLFSNKSFSVAAPLYNFSVKNIRTEGLKSSILLRLRDIICDSRYEQTACLNKSDSCIHKHSEVWSASIRQSISSRFTRVVKVLTFILLYGSKKIVNEILNLFGLGETLKVTLRKSPEDK